MKPIPLSALCLLMLTSPSWAQTLDVRVTDLHGDITLVNTAHGVRGAIHDAGVPLEEGDLLKTGADSMVEVAMAGRTLLHLGEWSVLKFTILEPKSALLSLTNGTLL